MVNYFFGILFITCCCLLGDVVGIIMTTSALDMILESDLIPSPTPDVLDSHERLLETDKTLGTAFAPTTPSGKCLNSEDYSIWTKNGYDNFGADMQHCAESCTGSLVPGNCGFLANCDPYPYRTCVTKCMGNPSTSERATLKLISAPYSANCSACMGSLSQCVVDNCTSKCLTGEKSESCETCTVNNCNGDFMVCSGVNPGRVSNNVDTTALLGGVIGGAGFLLICSVTFACVHFGKGRKVKELSVEDLAKLAMAQQQQAIIQAQQQQYVAIPQQQKITQQDVIKMMQQAQQHGVIPLSNPPTMMQNMTPYQQQYMMQQQQQQQPLAPQYQTNMQTPILSSDFFVQAPQRYIPSMSAQKMYQTNVSIARSDAVAQTIELQVVYDFVGERDDELTCKKGEMVFGIEESDGWWLARSQNNIIGLIPSSYVSIKDVRIGGGIRL